MTERERLQVQLSTKDSLIVATTTGDQLTGLAGDRKRATRALEIVEARCHICRNTAVRRAVNDLLDWHGAALPGGGRVSYRDILTAIRKDNVVRSCCDRLTYTSLWNHAKRHYDHDAVMAYWAARLDKEFCEALARI